MKKKSLFIITVVLVVGLVICSEDEEKGDIRMSLTLKYDSLMIPKCDGRKTIAKCYRLFRKGTHKSPERFNHPSSKTGVTYTKAYRTIDEGSFQRALTILLRDIEKSCLTQHQISVFCNKYKRLLKEDDRNVILFFKDNGQYFIADAHGGISNCSFFMNITNIEDTRDLYEDDRDFLFIIPMKKRLF